MRVNFHLVKSFLRQSLTADPSVPGTWVDDPQTAITRLALIQQGYHEAAAADDGTVTMSTIEGKTFQFQVSPGLSAAQVMTICEESISRIEAMIDANAQLSPPLTDSVLVDRIRGKYLGVRQSRTRSNFSTLSL